MSENLSNKLYIGIDLREESAMLSYFYPGMERPATISFVAGSDDYRLPMLIAKRKGIGHWSYGNEAVRMQKEQGGTVVDNLLYRAMKDEHIEIEGKDYPVQELFLLYMKKILSLPNKLDYHREIGYLTIAVRKVSEPCVLLLEKLRESLKLKKEEFEVIDYKECFYFYSCNQEETLQNHQVGLFDGEDGEITYLGLKKNKQTKPIVVEIEQEELGRMTNADKDRQMLEMAGRVLGKKLVSAVYFVGEEFDGEWMDESLRYICRGRRAFLGKNLYSLGACFASFQKNSEEWKYIYLGDSAFKMNISLKVRHRNELEFYSLVSAGENWYHSRHSCDVILDGTNTIELWLQHPYGREAKIENLEIADLPDRPNKTTRIRIEANLLADNKAEIILKDLGFGELYPKSGKVWKYTIDF